MTRKMHGHPELNFDGPWPLPVWEYPMMKELEPHILEEVKAYEAEYPHTFDMLKVLANEAYEHGVREIPMKALFERLRWHYNVSMAMDHGGRQEINDHLQSVYARLLMWDDNKFIGMFKTRPSRKPNRRSS